MQNLAKETIFEAIWNIENKIQGKKKWNNYLKMELRRFLLWNELEMNGTVYL